MDEDYNEYDEQQIGPDEYAYYCYQMGYVDAVDHADPGNYAALDALVGQMETDLLAHEALLC